MTAPAPLLSARDLTVAIKGRGLGRGGNVKRSVAWMGARGLAR